MTSAFYVGYRGLVNADGVYAHLSCPECGGGLWVNYARLEIVQQMRLICDVCAQKLITEREAAGDEVLYHPAELLDQGYGRA